MRKWFPPTSVAIALYLDLRCGKAGMALDDSFVKVVSWYDNEWGYCSKILEMARVIGK